MSESIAGSYDAIIIGAGISGLVCGCYLAKSGMKVLIAEQHDKPGGYCTSFRRRGFLFDAAAHSFGSFRRGGTMWKVFEDLELLGRLKVHRDDPSDVIRTPGRTFSFWSDHAKTIDQIAQVFPQERRIGDFFGFLSEPQPSDIAKLRRSTFSAVLDSYIRDEHLKAMIALPLFGYGGLPPSLMSAFAGIKILSEFLLDGGYYPEGGMQALSDLFAARFKEYGGTLLLSTPAKQIRVKDAVVAGVIIGNGDLIQSRIAISNCDARQTFLSLVGAEHVGTALVNKVTNMQPSLSMIVIYLGLSGSPASFLRPGTNEWFLSHYDLEKAYRAACQADWQGVGGCMVRLSPDSRTILAFVNTSYQSERYWALNKHSMLETFINNMESQMIPGLSRFIVHKEAATPHTLNRYTRNYHGAAYGWQSTPAQFADSEMRRPSSIQGLYLTGHWTTLAQGIPGVAYLGYDSARTIIRKYKDITENK